MKRWGFGLIGCGAIADVHLKALAELDRARIVGVSSRTEERARSTGGQWKCGWTTDYRKLLADPEVEIVCVTTSSGTHGPIGLEAIRAGKHLVVEKPIAMTSAEAEAMVMEAERNGVTLSVIAQNRFYDHHRWIKRVVEEGRIGKLLLAEISRPYYRTQAYYDSADWRGTIAEDGGALMNQGIHSIDLLLWIAGGVRSVNGRTATLTHRMEAEDLGLAILTMENGAFATVMCSTSMAPGFEPTFHLYGEKGAIRVEGSRVVHWSVPDVPLPDSLQHLESKSSAADPRNVSHQYHQLQLLDVMDAIEAGRAPLVTGRDGMAAVRLIEMIYRSSGSDGLSIEAR
ncbi:MAG TPA: Gfo/Idh/MocA family oxidoreductase [Paenibacillus sp.]|nr:Gfo/Idh/MocA family oxidoreductase [Paenibacillus sp.]